MWAEIPMLRSLEQEARSSSGSFLLSSSKTAFSSSYVVGMALSSFWRCEAVENWHLDKADPLKTFLVPVRGRKGPVRGKSRRNMEVIFSRLWLWWVKNSGAGRNRQTNQRVQKSNRKLSKGDGVRLKLFADRIYRISKTLAVFGIGEELAISFLRSLFDKGGPRPQAHFVEKKNFIDIF